MFHEAEVGCHDVDSVGMAAKIIDRDAVGVRHARHWAVLTETTIACWARAWIRSTLAHIDNGAIATPRSRNTAVPGGRVSAGCSR